ncbi:MAG: S-layer homology domain-containing protein, partial [Tissierellia bacterium]|nr:S-layer homology domain-containing protein [Tissierellia bacterium]
HADVEEINYGIETDYSDVNATDWYAKHISYVSDKGLMEGYEDGAFKPEAKITRAEYATVVARFQKLEQVETSFEDSKDHWANGYIGAVYNKGWITGYPDGTFKPTANISREEVATMTNKMLDRNVDGVGLGDLSINKFTDLEFGTWSYYEIVEASNTHEYVRRSEHTTVENWKNIK